MKRFLRYAVEHDRKLRAVFLLDGEPVQKTVSVVEYTDETVTLRAGKKKTFTLPIGDLLACTYARGDSGEE